MLALLKAKCPGIPQGDSGSPDLKEGGKSRGLSPGFSGACTEGDIVRLTNPGPDALSQPALGQGLGQLTEVASVGYSQGICRQ